MYLKEIYIEKNGVIEQLNLLPGFGEDGNPKPLVLVGGNGSGKTNFLSIAADALFEVAAAHFSDVTSNAEQIGRAYFRIVGGITIKADSVGSAAVLRFLHEDAEFAFIEKAGTLDADDLRQRISGTLSGYIHWDADGNTKKCTVDPHLAKNIFESGAYVYFPSSRSESPYWLNEGSIAQPAFDLVKTYGEKFKKPIFVEKGLHKLKQWLLTILLDLRADVQPVNNNNVTFWVALHGIERLPIVHAVWATLNSILRTILDCPTARLVWLGRHNKGGVGYSLTEKSPSLPLESLSAGQATLFNIFGTLMRYGDGTTREYAQISTSISGVCIVDEIDAHMHIDLQCRAIPALIQMFPKVQFILSSHSPMFVLGMNKIFGVEKFDLINMPFGDPLQAEAYTEFGRAFDVLRETQAFNNEIRNAVGESVKILVLVEGETDPEYLRAAMVLFEITNLLDFVDIQWIGAKDPRRGDGFNTGKDALNAAYSFLRAKPELVKNHICFFYDNDSKKLNVDEGKLSIRVMPSNLGNGRVKFGIENLLPEDIFQDQFFDHKESDKGNGTSTSVRSLNKMRLCEWVCRDNPRVENFSGFKPVLLLIAEIAEKNSQYEIPQIIKQ